MRISINSSISDFPVFSRLENCFAMLKDAGVDGVELNMGIKSRWTFASVNNLSQKYNLPIQSIHQPLWSGLRIAFDEKFVLQAQTHGITKIVFHPLCFLNIRSKKMRKYFKRLSLMQEKYGINVMLETMPYNKSLKSIDYWAMEKSNSDLENIFQVAEEFNFQITYDTSHSKLEQPQSDAAFKKIFPKIANIHLSSFHGIKEHLPLYMGDFDTKGFLTFLLNKKYSGLVTLEILYPKLFPLRKYDFLAIKKSVQFIRNITDKL